MTESKAADTRLADIALLYRTRFQHFLRVALAITRDYEQALDAVQEGFGDAIRSRLATATRRHSKLGSGAPS